MENEPDGLLEAPSFETTDLGNADRLHYHFGSILRYCYAMKGWYKWDGVKWIEDAGGEIARCAESTVRRIRDEIPKGDSETLAKWAFKSQEAKHIRSMIGLAQPKMEVDVEQFDAAPWLLNCLNGTIDLTTGKLYEHSQKDYLTKIVPFQYNPEATCPNFERFMLSIMKGRQNLVDFLQRAIGYSLTGLTTEQCLFIFFGAGANGKSTLLDILTELMADYGRTCPTETLMAKRSDGGVPNDIARLRGSRFVSASETGEDRRLNEVLVKQLTGSDKITARFLHKEFFEFVPQFKVFLATNHKPIVRGVDNAIWRRIHLVPFDVKYWNPEKGETGAEETMMDKTLPMRLREEMEGIFAWCVRGCLLWQQDGLVVPEEIARETKEYRDSMDVLGQFFDEECEVDDEYTETAARLYNAYARWCDSSGEESITKKAFGQRLQERGFMKGSNGSARMWKGIQLNARHDVRSGYEQK